MPYFMVSDHASPLGVLLEGSPTAQGWMLDKAIIPL